MGSAYRSKQCTIILLTTINNYYLFTSDSLTTWVRCFICHSSVHLFYTKKPDKNGIFCTNNGKINS